MSFDQFALTHVRAASFRTDPDDPKTDLFHASLESAQAAFRWTGKARNRAGAPFDLHAGFLDLNRPNARADVWRGRQYIAMHSSLFVCISDFAFFCFTQKDFFPDVGNPAAETSPKPWDDRVPGLWLLDFTMQGGHVDDSHSQRLIPRDSERFTGAVYLALLMARFTWLHELAHCFNGHVGFARKHGLALHLHELTDGLYKASVGKDEKTPEDIEALQCLEFDADQSALWASFNIQRHNLENIEGIAALDLGLRLRLTLFGAYAMVWLIEQLQGYMDAQEALTHPSPTLRLHNLFRTAASQIVPTHSAMGALHADVLRQFDVIRAAIPQMYGTEELTARLRDVPLMDSLKKFDPQLDDLKRQLQDFEFSETHDTPN